MEGQWAVLSFQLQVLSSFRVSPMDQSNNPHATHMRKWGGFSCFIHPCGDAVDETLYNPVFLPCSLFGQKSQKRLQPEGIVFPAVLPIASVFIHEGRASGNGRTFVVLCPSAFWAVARMLCSQAELEACVGVRFLLREDLRPSLVDTGRVNIGGPELLTLNLQQLGARPRNA